MINYSVLEMNNEYLIQAQHDNAHWLAEIVFDCNEKVYADAMCRILNDEAKRAFDLGQWNGKQFEKQVKLMKRGK
jgi:hypothetical protein